MKNVFTNARVVAYQLLFLSCLVVAGCAKKSSNNTTDTTIPATTSKIDTTAISTGKAEGSTEAGANADDLVEGSSFTSTVNIVFGATITITNPLSAAGVKIVQTGGDLVINSTATGVEFNVSGTIADGSVKIYSDKKFKLTLNNANITNLDGPAINIQSTKRAFIVVADGTTNTLADGANYTPFGTEDMKGTIFAEGQVIFSGTGTLNVKSNFKHAIVSDSYIRVRTGTINVTAALSDGIHVNDFFIADGGTINIKSSDDGIEAEKGYVIINGGTFTINSFSKGISAPYVGTDATITPYININGGSLTINEASGEGISCKAALTINKGNISTKTVNDGLNAETAIYINGGNVYCYSTANDAMDSNGTFTVTGGKVIAVGAVTPESGIDCNTNVLKITGGIVVAIGGTTSGPSATASTINSVVAGGGTAGKIVHIEAADHTEALTFLSPVDFATLLYASAKLKTGTTYNIYTDGSVASGTAFNGLYLTGTYTTGTKIKTFTTTGIVTQVGGTISTN